MSDTLDSDDRNPRVTLGKKDCFMCWSCGHLNFHSFLWCLRCDHGRFDGGELRMRLSIHELLLAAATNVPGAREIFEVIESS